MVEGQPEAAVAGIDDGHGPGVVAGPGSAAGPGDEHRRDRVQAGVPPRVGIGPELAEELDLERSLLAGLADGRLLERLPVVHEAAGQGPAGGRVPPIDEDDARPGPAGPDLDDDVDGRDGVAVSAAGHLSSRTYVPIVWTALPPCQTEGDGNVPISSRSGGGGVLDGGQSWARAYRPSRGSRLA